MFISYWETLWIIQNDGFLIVKLFLSLTIFLSFVYQVTSFKTQKVKLSSCCFKPMWLVLQRNKVKFIRMFCSVSWRHTVTMCCQTPNMTKVLESIIIHTTLMLYSQSFWSQVWQVLLILILEDTLQQVWCICMQLYNAIKKILSNVAHVNKHCDYYVNVIMLIIRTNIITVKCILKHFKVHFLQN